MLENEIWVKVRVVDRCLEIVEEVVDEFEDGFVVERVIVEMLEIIRNWLVDGDERRVKVDELIELFE